MKHNKNGIRRFFDFVDRNHEAIDMFAAAFLALCPLLQHYIGPIYNLGITVLTLLALYLLIRILGELPSISFQKISFVLVIVIYQLFRIVNHGTSVTELGQSGVFIIFMLALAFGKINTSVMLKVCKAVSLVASFILVLQTVVYYAFGVHLQVVVTSWLIPAADQWIGSVETGLISITGKMNNFYRPTAFFLEPAHVYIYMFPHLILLLLDEKFSQKKFWMAILISLGLFLCTSGMGIAAVGGCWVFFLLFRNHQDGTFGWKNMFRKTNLIALFAIIAAAVLIVWFVPAARRAIVRIFVPNKAGTTAISGRISQALKMVSGMTVTQWIIGVADNTRDIAFHIPGLIDVLYRHGLVGMLLSYELYVKCIFKLRLSYKLMGLAILITSLFSAHTHSTIGMLYFLLILMNGFQHLEPAHPGVKPYLFNVEKENACPFLRIL